LDDLGRGGGILKYILNRAGKGGLDSLRSEQGVVARPYVHGSRRGWSSWATTSAYRMTRSSGNN
jgi:hypothetical protein